MAKASAVPRPRRKLEYEIRFGSSAASKGWTDLKATQLNALTDAWEFLTKTPLEHTSRNHPLKGSLQHVSRDGVQHERWQYELTGGARIWFYVEDGIVWLERVATKHPNETK